jgi:PleD family two-component response regulator
METVAVEGAPAVRATASFGVARLGDGDDGKALVARADRALYAVKQAGGNRVAGEAGLYRTDAADSRADHPAPARTF